LTLAFQSISAAKAADAEPTVDQVYQASRVGHLEEAQQMMNKVLRAHPDSAKAHYVQAELYAKEGHRDMARSELARAEQLKPGLPEIEPSSVRELKRKLGLPGG
jgi:Tfp pilus assembly protein PilF